MRVDFLSQAGKLLKEQKQLRRWLIVFFCLAVIVLYGTFTALKLYGQAMTHKVEVLDCQYEVHTHTDECYEIGEDGSLGTEPVCGYADYVVHVHNDGCYDANGNLVCTLEEHEAHTHTEECYVTEKVLICGEEAADGSAGTVSGDEASAENQTAPSENATPESGAVSSEGTPETQPAGEAANAADPAGQTGSADGTPETFCGKEAHTHDENCYEDAFACGYEEEHIHEEACLSRTLSCQNPEHTHGEECRDEQGNLICGLEEHKHLVGCFDINGNVICQKEIHVHEDSCRDGEGNLICGLEEHTGHFAGCYTQEYICGKAEHTHQEECHTQNLVCELEEHKHTEDCYKQPESQGETTASAEATPEPTESTGMPESTASGTEAQTGTGHVHTDACYKEVKVLVCGELELHTHDDSCYAEECFNEDGSLKEGSLPTCGLLQLEEHVHAGDCFKTVELTPEEVAALNNGAKLHIHKDDCYDEEGNLICGHDATHIHVLECYDDAGKLICGYGTASHVHEEKCYDKEGNLVCGYGTAAHVHEDSCYDKEGNLQCGYETAVQESEEARQHEHDANCYDDEGNLTCGYEDAKDHEHDKRCYDEEGNLTCGHEDAKDHEHDADCYDILGNLVCGYEGAENHIHTEICYDEQGNPVCGYEVLESCEYSKTFRNDRYVVAARYNNDAGIPEDAELTVEEITSDIDKEHYDSREAEYQMAVDDEEAAIRALLKIGFYWNGEEVKPKTPVTISIQFVNEYGLIEGKPIVIVQFAEEEIKKIEGSDAKDNITTFILDSFSEIAIGYGVRVPEITEDGTLYISDSFEHETAPFHITFQVEGEVKTTDEPPVEDKTAAAGQNDPVSAASEDETGEEAVKGGISGDAESSEEAVESGKSDDAEKTVDADTTVQSGISGETENPEEAVSNG